LENLPWWAIHNKGVPPQTPLTSASLAGAGAGLSAFGADGGDVEGDAGAATASGAVGDGGAASGGGTRLGGNRMRQMLTTNDIF